MRNNPPLKKGTILAENACIFWDSDLGIVSVVEVGRTVPHEVNKLRYSGGACYAQWREDCSSNSQKAQILCLRQFWNLVYIYEIDPVTADNALSEIIEYQAAFKD